MPGCDEDISLKGDGDLSDGEFYSWMVTELGKAPRWVQWIVALVAIVVGVIATVVWGIVLPVLVLGSFTKRAAAATGSFVKRTLRRKAKSNR